MTPHRFSLICPQKAWFSATRIIGLFPVRNANWSPFLFTILCEVKNGNGCCIQFIWCLPKLFLLIATFPPLAIWYLCSRNWTSLPALPAPRIFHGCGTTHINQSTYLVVYGGHYIDSKGVPVLFWNILILDMDATGSTWQVLPGSKFITSNKYINGGIIKRLTSTECNMMFVDPVNNLLQACTGNFNWTSTQMNRKLNYTDPYFVAVGVNVFKSCL